MVDSSGDQPIMLPYIVVGGTAKLALSVLHLCADYKYRLDRAPVCMGCKTGYRTQ